MSNVLLPILLSYSNTSIIFRKLIRGFWICSIHKYWIYNPTTCLRKHNTCQFITHNSSILLIFKFYMFCLSKLGLCGTGSSLFGIFVRPISAQINCSLVSRPRFYLLHYCFFRPWSSSFSQSNSVFFFQPRAITNKQLININIRSISLSL